MHGAQCVTYHCLNQPVSLCETPAVPGLGRGDSREQNARRRRRCGRVRREGRWGSAVGPGWRDETCGGGC
ncbi:hypothetical protein HMPREF1549_00350 [Actinomyces johnsonii F0510]|nr:hypothetical protein HMPREF1549_00350 [Actinomyces johnsonii F0510]